MKETFYPDLEDDDLQGVPNEEISKFPTWCAP
jgi:hypothetical protein